LFFCLLTQRHHQEHRELYRFSVLDSSQLPYYMRTGASDTDAYYSWFENTLSSHKSKPPLFARKMNAAGALIVNSSTDQFTTAAPAGLSDVRQAALYDAFGLSAIRVAAPADVTLWNKLVTSSYVDPAVQEALISNTAAEAAAIAGYFNQSSLGSDYAAVWSANHGGRPLASGVSEAFARFVEEEVLELAKDPADTARVEKAQRVFGGITGLIASARRANVTRPSITLDRAYINKLVSMGASRKRVFDSDSYSQKASASVTPAGIAGAGVVDLRNEWVNTRLSISRDHFVQLESVASMPGASSGDIIFLANLPVRPANPANPHEPLSTTIINVSGGKATPDTLTIGKSHAGIFKYAQAFPYTRGFTDDFFWRHPGLYRAYSGGESAQAQRQRTSYLAQTMGGGVPAGYAQTAFSSGSGQGAFLAGGSLPIDPSSNIVMQEQEYVSASGMPLPDKTTYAQKHNLLYRVEQIYKDEKDPLVRQAAILMNLSKSNGASELIWCKHGLLIPVSTYVLYQYDIQFRTTPAIFYRGGGDTARFGSRWDDATEQYDGTHKQILWHFTTWMACTIIDEKNFLFVKHVKVEEYVRGMDGLIYDDPSQFDVAKPQVRRRLFGCAYV